MTRSAAADSLEEEPLNATPGADATPAEEPSADAVEKSAVPGPAVAEPVAEPAVA